MRGKTKKGSVVFVAVIAAFLTQAGIVSAQPVIAAYQKLYDMNFQVWQPEGLPMGWYVTFDGYPVAQVARNHWVYGRPGPGGSIVPLDVAVGSVVPMDVPELARAVVSGWRRGVLDTPEFRAVTRLGFDNIGVLGDPLAFVPVAWKTGDAELLIWLGDHWYSLVPAGGQSTYDALKNRHSFIVKTLAEKAEKNIVWTRSDTEDLADLSREWGYVWRGIIPFASLTAMGQGGGESSTTTAGAFAGIGGSGGGTGSGGQWDVGGDSGSTTGGGSGGWDTGDNSGGGSSGGGSGWDTGGGSGSGGNTDVGSGSDGGNSGGNSGGGWDK
ncbi:MAG: hypothetical protein LBR61_02080 [Synergistaceae bacterium]|jgi:hypothetical protein|nr:hypothetical protein [Synergistaceae bacterium]